MYIVLFDNNKCIIFSIKIRNIFYCFSRYTSKRVIPYPTKRKIIYCITRQSQVPILKKISLSLTNNLCN